MSRGYGAMPPPTAEWQVGKTASSIKFVNEAALYQGKQEDVDKVREHAERIKSGKIVLKEPLTIEDFLAQDN